ncbi:DNA-directed DNA polymerase, partial [Ascoidea rubescens DSM 1968]
KFNVVPVIRIFGSLKTGHTVLVHIHGVYPYFFLDFKNILVRENVLKKKYSDKENSDKYIDDSKYDFTRNNYFKYNSTKQRKNFKYIADVSVVKSTPFYGYNIGYKLFYKVSLLSPVYHSKLVNIINENTITSPLLKNIKIYESHIPYILQFLTDFNLFGCSWLNIDKNLIFLRNPIFNIKISPSDNEKDKPENQNQNQNNNANEIINQNNSNVLLNIKRIGRTFLEIDIPCQSISNRSKLKKRDLHHDFLEYFQHKYNKDYEANFKEKYLSSTDEIIKDTNYQRKLRNKPSFEPQPSIERALNINDKNFTDWNKNENENELSFENYITNINNFNNVNETLLKHIKTPMEILNKLFPVLPKNKVTLQKINEETKNSSFFDNDDFINFSDDNIYDIPLNNNPIGNFDGKNFTSDNNVDNAKTNNDNNNNKKLPAINQNSSHIDRNTKGISTKSEKLFTNEGFLANSSPMKFPDSDDIMESFEKEYDLPKIEYNDPFYSAKEDILKTSHVYAGKKYILKCSDKDFENQIANFENHSIKRKININNSKIWKYVIKPPSYNEVDVDQIVHDTHIKKSKEFLLFSSQVEPTTQKVKFGFKYQTPKHKIQKKPNQYNHLTVFTIEIHVNARPDFVPDPLVDEITAIFWKFEEETMPFDLGISNTGIFLLDSKRQNLLTSFSRLTTIPIGHYEELEMLIELGNLVQLVDPDILAGFEVHSSSWGYVIERSRAIYQYDLCEALSRVSSNYKNKVGDKWGYTHASAFKITGRHMINIWRHLRSIFDLQKYSIENITYHVLHERIAYYDCHTLTSLFHGLPGEKAIFLNYWLKRIEINLKLLQSSDLISRTAEQARLGGIDFYSVLYRGSQYKVESFMVRMCKAENFMLYSPSKKQVQKQTALDCIPLVMEPDSSYFKSPVVVLDFQSLYPSVMIAYNYCYSTILGKLQGFDAKNGNEIGCINLKLPAGLLELLEDDITISPNGYMFVKPNIRKSLLAKMLEELLESRIMVKETMDLLKDDRGLYKLFYNRQLGLKLVANVTYGYTSATFSGRMPCSAVADSIVQTGREILEKSVEFIENNEKWNAKVVYGDTDSLFVCLMGKSKDEAFEIGREIAESVTKRNPKPIKLKFEKVYFPSVLIAKKRYVGYSYEFKEQVEPKFDAKGIETVRRDGTPAQQKILEKSLRMLFEEPDISKIKKYVQEQFYKIIVGKVSIKDFCFAKEVKIGSYKDVRYMPAGAALIAEKMEEDDRLEPQYKERVPYLIRKGKKGEILRKRAISPEEFINNPNKYELDYDYYIRKNIIPPLERVFNLIGVNVLRWYEDMPKFGNGIIENNKEIEKGGLNKYIKKNNCFICYKNEILKDFICFNCYFDKRNTVVKIIDKIKKVEEKNYKIKTICKNCSLNGKSNYSNDIDRIMCCNQDCSIYYQRKKSELKMEDLNRKERLV